MKPNYFVALLCLLPGFLSGCWTEIEPYDNGKLNVTGYAPVYSSAEQAQIKITEPQTVKNPGKIYVYGKYLLVNEINKGIHVFDNTNPDAPDAIAFINMPGNTDMAVKDDVLYSNHLNNLVALKTSQFTTIEKIGSLTIDVWNLGVPPPMGQYFECANADKGVVIDWVKTQLVNPDCYAIR